MKSSRLLLVQSILILAALASYHVLVIHPIIEGPPPDTLAVSEITLVDRRGTVRARLGTNLPDAVIDGRKVARGGEAAGLILYDADGQERSGYVTMEPGSNVMLTLDSKQGQVGLFAAGPDGGATARLWQGEDAVELRIDSAGARVTAVRNGRVAFQQPPTGLPDEACRAYRSARAEHGREFVLEACSGRFTVKGCVACLDDGNVVD